MPEEKNKGLYVNISVDENNNISVDANLLPRGVVAILANTIEQIIMSDEFEGEK